MSRHGSAAPRQRSTKPTAFLVLITGQIESVEIISVDNVYLKYCYAFGPDWRQVAGLEEGLSPMCYKSAQSNTITLNTPIEATFSSTNPFKWPQIILSLYGRDLFGNDVVRGYGVTHLPTVPGSSKRRVPVFVPQASTAIQRIIGFFTGRRAEFVDSRIIGMAEGRDVTRVSTQGFVNLTLTTIIKDMKKLGYDTCPGTMLRFSEFPLTSHKSDDKSSPTKETHKLGESSKSEHEDSQMEVARSEETQIEEQPSHSEITRQQKQTTSIELHEVDETHEIA